MFDLDPLEFFFVPLLLGCDCFSGALVGDDPSSDEPARLSKSSRRLLSFLPGEEQC